MSWFDRWISKVATSAAEGAINSGAFDSQIEAVVIAQIRKGYGDRPLTRVGFILNMAVEMIDCSGGALSFMKAKEYAYAAYEEFRRGNDWVRFGSEGWDWSASGAKTLAHEYEISYWEPAE